MKLMKYFKMYDTFCDLAAFTQFEKRKKHPWGSVTFSKVVGLSRFE